MSGHHQASHRSLSWSKNYWIAASIVALLAVVGIYLLYFNGPNNQDLFYSYYHPYPPDPITRGQASRQFSQALDYYKLHQYSEAALELEKIVATDTASLRAQLFLGNCYLNLDRSKLAITKFDKVLKSEDPVIRQHAMWYRGLAYLKNNEVANAKIIISEISNVPGIYMQRAQQLLREIE